MTKVQEYSKRKSSFPHNRASEYFFFVFSIDHNTDFYTVQSITLHDKWAPVTTAWRVLRLRMEERPPVMEGSCEYFE
jgi:hypothetical protein